MATYDKKQIANELRATALGQTYHGNALYVAQDMPEIINSPEHRLTISRYLKGIALDTDDIRLQEAALLIAPVQQYMVRQKLNDDEYLLISDDGWIEYVATAQAADWDELDSWVREYYEGSIFDILDEMEKAKGKGSTLWEKLDSDYIQGYDKMEDICDGLKALKDAPDLQAMIGHTSFQPTIDLSHIDNLCSPEFRAMLDKAEQQEITTAKDLCSDEGGYCPRADRHFKAAERISNFAALFGTALDTRTKKGISI